MKPFIELNGELNHAGIRFMITDLKLAQLFLDMALTSSDERRERLRWNARRALDTVVYFLPRCACSKAEALEIRAKLSQVRGRLNL